LIEIFQQLNKKLADENTGTEKDLGGETLQTSNSAKKTKKKDACC
jgi:hypothetical protein